MLLGNEVVIPDSILIDSFVNYVSNREAAILQTALSSLEMLLLNLLIFWVLITASRFLVAGI